MSSRPMAPYYDRVLQTESQGDPNAVSPKGARGLMQIMPGTARDPGFGLPPLRDNSPQANVEHGRLYLDAMHRRFGDPVTALMAYNWGPGNVERWIKRGRPADAVPKETRDYVKQITGGSITGNNGMATQGTTTTPALMMPEQKDPVAPTLARNPNAPAQITPRDVITAQGVQGVLAPQTAAVEADPAMTQLAAMNGMIDANVAAKQASVLGPEAVAFARQNNYALNDPRVAAFAADKNVGAFQKGLSFLQGIVGLPIGLLRNAALGENNDLTAAFRPERSYQTRAQAAIAALDAQGLAAKKDIAEMRQDTRQSIFTAIQPYVSQAYQTAGKQQEANIGGNLDERVINDALRANGFIDANGNIDRSSPAAQQFILSFLQQKSIAESAGKTSEVAAGLAAAGALAVGVSNQFYKSNQDKAGELGVKAYEDITTKGRIADTLVPKLDFLVAQSTKFGSQYAGFTGDIRKWIQESGAGIGIDPNKYKDLTDAQIFDSVANDVGITQAQRMPGTLAAQELGVALSIAGTYKDTAAARDIKLRTMRAGAKSEQAYRDAAMDFYRKNGNVFDEAAFRDSDSFKSMANRPLWYYDRSLLPAMVAGDRQRYGNFFRTKSGALVVKSGGKVYDTKALTNDQLLQLVGK